MPSSHDEHTTTAPCEVKVEGREERVSDADVFSERFYHPPTMSNFFLLPPLSKCPPLPSLPPSLPTYLPVLLRVVCAVVRLLQQLLQGRFLGGAALGKRDSEGGREGGLGEMDNNKPLLLLPSFLYSTPFPFSSCRPSVPSR